MRDIGEKMFLNATIVPPITLTPKGETSQIVGSEKRKRATPKILKSTCGTEINLHVQTLILEQKSAAYPETNNGAGRSA